MAIPTSRSEHNHLLILFKLQLFHDVIEVAMLHNFWNEAEFLFEAYDSPLKCFVSFFSVSYFKNGVLFLHELTENLFLGVLFIVARHGDCRWEKHSLTLLRLGFGNASEDTSQIRVESLIAQHAVGFI